MRKQGDWVLAEAVGALRRLNLKPYDDERYWKVATAIDDVLMFPNKTLATGEGRETTLQTARRLRGERALQLWRLLTTKWAAGLGRVDIWKARVAEWRLARPVASGPRAGARTPDARLCHRQAPQLFVTDTQLTRVCRVVPVVKHRMCTDGKNQPHSDLV